MKEKNSGVRGEERTSPPLAFEKGSKRKERAQVDSTV